MLRKFKKSEENLIETVRDLKEQLTALRGVPLEKRDKG